MFLSRLDYPDLKNLSTILELCQPLTKLRKSRTFYFIDCLIYLILILRVSTTTIKRSIFTMKIIKTRLRNKIGGEFLAHDMIIYVKKIVEILVLI